MTDTEHTDDTNSTPEATDSPDQPASDEAPHDPADAVKKARSDAASYRRRLREVEGERDALASERDALRGQVAARQRADVESLAASLPNGLQDGSDIWTGTQLDHLLDDTGEVDQEKVKATVAELVKAKPHWAQTPGSFDLGVRGEALSNPGPGWADVLKGGPTNRRGIGG